MPATVGTNWSSYATLAEASRVKAGARTDEALSNDEKTALCDCAHALRESGVDLLTFALNAANAPLSAEQFWAQAHIATPMLRTPIS